MAQREGSIWVNGDFVDWEKANFHVLTHSLHYGLSVFEGIRAYKTPKGTAIFKLEDHIERLFNSAKIYQIEIPYKFKVNDSIVTSFGDNFMSVLLSPYLNAHPKNLLYPNFLSAPNVRPLV